MPRILTVRDHRLYLGDEALSELGVRGYVPPHVVIQMDDLWLKLREPEATEMHREWEEMIPPRRAEHESRLREGGHVSTVGGEEVVAIEVRGSRCSELGDVEPAAEDHVAGPERCHSLGESGAGRSEDVCVD